MDRQWMYTDKRISNEFFNGLNGFLEVAESNKPPSGFIICPCRKCRNLKDFSTTKTLHDHLYKWGFMPNYFVWTNHGERGVIIEDDEEDDNIPDWTQEGAFAMGDDPMGEDDVAIIEGEPEQGEDEPLDDLGQVLREQKEDCEKGKEAKKFDRMLEDHKKPLYPNCKEGHKKLGSTLEMLQ